MQAPLQGNFHSKDCATCGTLFQGIKTKKYCSEKCRFAAARHKKRKITRCVVCQTTLAGKARMYCSSLCKSEAHSHSYEHQQVRGLGRKLALVKEKGGGCSVCGYQRNLGALVFHHRDEATKSFNLDMRSLSNHSSAAIHLEAQKCDLLCSNCHQEFHHPQLEMTLLEKKDPPANS